MTLRELVVMSETRSRLELTQTGTLLSQMVGLVGKSKKPSDFFPALKQATGKTQTYGSPEEFEGLFKAKYGQEQPCESSPSSPPSSS